MRSQLASLFILGLILAIIPAGVDYTSTAASETCRHGIKASFTDHDPIEISSNADFENQEWPGDGTKEDPYVIEALRIVSSSICISIEDTTVYFGIRDCIISSPNRVAPHELGFEDIEDGIVFDNVVHGSVHDSSVEFHSSGIRLENSPDCVLKNNLATSNHFAFTIVYSDNCVMTNNNASGNSDGYYLYKSHDCTLKENIAMNNAHNGLEMWESHRCSLINNTLVGNEYGFHLSKLENCIAINNTFVDNGIYLFGSEVSDWLHDMSGNRVNSKPLGYFKNQVGISINASQYGQVILANCSNLTVQDGIFNNGTVGIEVGFCRICLLLNNTATSNSGYGFYLYESDSCTANGNIATNNLRGFTVLSSLDCLLEGNIAFNNHYGFNLYESERSVLSSNTATCNSADGFHLQYVDDSTLENNTALGNSRGAYVNGSNNLLFLNRFGYNWIENGYDTGSTNHWDNGTHGNYWSDYNGTGTYTVSGGTGSIDNHPFVLRLVSPFVNNPDNLTITEGQTHKIIWRPRDWNPHSYEVYRNGTLIESGEWDGDNIIVALGDLTAGTYIYTLVVNDTSGNSASDMVFVTVLPSDTVGIPITQMIYLVGIIGIAAVVGVAIIPLVMEAKEAK